MRCIVIALMAGSIIQTTVARADTSKTALHEIDKALVDGTFATQLATEIEVRGLVFSDAACQRQFGQTRKVMGDDLAALAGCLSKDSFHVTYSQPHANKAVRFRSSMPSC